jgi:alpha-L-rhamnosidase
MLRRRELLVGSGVVALGQIGPVKSAVPKAGASDRPTGLMVDLRDSPTGIIPERAGLSWIAPFSSQGGQRAYQLQAASTRSALLKGHADYDSGRIEGTSSASIPWPKPVIERDGHCFWRVRIWDGRNTPSAWSEPQHVIGAAGKEWQADAIWVRDGDALANWMLARSEFDVPQDVEALWVDVTASSPEAARQFVYRLMLNGDFVGVGPVRSYDAKTEARYATYDLTDRAKPGRNALAAFCYAAEGQAFLARITIVRRSGERRVIGRQTDWRVLSGDRWRPAADFTQGGWYKAPQEYIDARQEPVGWERPGFDDSAWSRPEPRPFPLDLVPQRVDGMAISLVRPNVVRIGSGRWLFDLGREIVGGVRLTVQGTAGQTVELRLGEEKSVDGGARYQLRTTQIYREIWTLRSGHQQLEHWGYRAFRWIEVLCDPALDIGSSLVGVQLAMPWRAQDASFSSSHADLDRVWNLCRYSIEALRLDLYQDTPARERGPYEGDAIVNQLSEFAVQRSYALSRYSTGYLARRPTWPTEYRMQTPVLAWRDYMATGDKSVLADNYGAMQARMRLDRFNADGLVEKDIGGPGIAESDLVDWPIANRDGFAFTRVNAVVNMWQFASLTTMAQVAGALGRADDHARCTALAKDLRGAINKAFLGADGTYLDGIGTTHRSQHATAYAVALGLIPEDRLAQAGRVLATQGMRMSVYGAQFLLEALYISGQSEAALRLMTSREHASWLHMMDGLGATIAAEAWDPDVKPNTTFSHAWGTAPVNIAQRYIAGVSVTSPGAATLRIKPEPGGLSRFSATVPTIRGPVQVRFDAQDPLALLDIRLPANVAAELDLGGTLLAGHDPHRLRILGASGQAVVANRGLRLPLAAGEHIRVRR